MAANSNEIFPRSFNGVLYFIIFPQGNRWVQETLMLISKFPKSVMQYIFLLSIIFDCSYSHAVLVSFDDIERLYEYDYPFRADQPMTDQHLAKGLIIDGGY